MYLFSIAYYFLKRRKTVKPILTAISYEKLAERLFFIHEPNPPPTPTSTTSPSALKLERRPLQGLHQQRQTSDTVQRYQANKFS